jgi:hypothetical protein
MAPDFTTVRRFVGWFSIAVLGVASWLPAEEMIRTGADGRLEHAAAYLIGDFHRIPSKVEVANRNIDDVLRR